MSSPPHPAVEAPGVDLTDQEIADVDLVLPAGYYDAIRGHLLADTSREYLCHALCGLARVGDRLRMLACVQVVPGPEDYAGQSLGGLRMRTEYDLAIRNECLRQSYSLVDFHSHPFAHNAAFFSGTDDADEYEKYAYFRRNLTESVYASVVMSPGAEVGRVFLPGPGGEPRLLPLRIVRLDVPLAPVGSSETDDEPRFDRQVRAFGRDGQRRLAALRVGVVGLGGLGSLLALGLTRLGVRRFTLIDSDRADETNLNRLAGMTATDARLRTVKVDLAARRMTEIDPAVEVEAVAGDVFDPAAWQTLRGCDLLVAATDTNATRMMLNALSFQYLIPLVSAGTYIRTENGAVAEGHGEICTVVPGQERPCLVCGQVIDKLEAYYDLAPDESRRAAAARGYIEAFDEPAPAVYHLNGVVAHQALLEIHNLACGFMPPAPHLLYFMKGRQFLSMTSDPLRCAVCAPNGWNFARGDRVDPVANLFPLGAEGGATA